MRLKDAVTSRRSFVESEHESMKSMKDAVTSRRSEYERPKVGADVRLKDAVTNMVPLHTYNRLHVFSGAADLNLDLNVHWSRETKSEILLRQVLQVLTSLPEDCTTCTIALQGDVARVTIYNSIEEFIVAFETPGYYGDKWHRERYRQLEW